MSLELTPRQAKILASIVKEYCETNEPVASKELVEKYDFAISGATVRNEMQALEKMGYIMHPHTSAGRIPTDAGFRYFVNQLMERVKLTSKEQERLKIEIHKLQAINQEIGRRLAKVLSESSQAASFAILPGEVSTTGIANILDNPQLPAEDAKEIAQFFDNIDEYAEGMLKEYSNKKSATAYIGKEITLSQKGDHSMIVSGVTLPSGQKGVIGLLGPKSMKYEKNLTLMEYISKLLGGGSALVLCFMLIK